MTRSEIRTRILYQLNDSPTDPVAWSNAELDAVIQEAEEVLAEEAQGLHRTAYIPRHDGMQFVTLASISDDIMAITRIWDNENEHRLQPLSMTQLDTERNRWMEDTGDRPYWWFPVAWNLFGVHPPTAIGGGTLRIDYLAWPTPMEEDGQSPEWPEADHDSLVLYGVYLGLMKQWDAQRGLDLFVQFTQAWQGSKARNGIRRVKAGRMQRHGQGRRLYR